jgi:hypothetical protein
LILPLFGQYGILFFILLVRVLTLPLFRQYGIFVFHFIS